MITLKQAGIAVLCIITVFAVGRYTAPTKTVTVTKTVEVETKVKDSDTNINNHTHTVTTVKETKDGGTETVTIQDSGTETKESAHEQDSKAVVAEASTTTERTGSTLHLFALGGVQGFNFSQPIVGGGISKNVLGPITAGAWGLSNACYGVSIGLTF